MKKTDWNDIFVKAVLLIATAFIVFFAVKYCVFGRTVEIDGCEYIRSGYALTHKGNCKYCIERTKK